MLPFFMLTSPAPHPLSHRQSLMVPRLRRPRKSAFGLPPLCELCVSAFSYPFPSFSCARNSHRITSFAHPHHLTTIESYSYKKRGGGPPPLPPKPFHSFPHPVNTLRTPTPATIILSITCAHLPSHTGVPLLLSLLPMATPFRHPLSPCPTPSLAPPKRLSSRAKPRDLLFSPRGTEHGSRAKPPLVPPYRCAATPKVPEWPKLPKPVRQRGNISAPPGV